MSNLIHFYNVSYQEDSRDLIKNFSADVLEGEVVALVGENGSGKSLLLDLLLGNISAARGAVAVKCSPSVLYDHLPLFYLLTVDETIDYFLSIHKLKRDDKFNSICERLKIESIGSTLTSKLSLGEKKRVGLAIALIGDPKLLILDEPFANLDPTIIDTVWEIIKENSRTIFITTHDWDDLHQHASKVIFLHKGEKLGFSIDPKKESKNLKELYLLYKQDKETRS